MWLVFVSIKLMPTKSAGDGVLGHRRNLPGFLTLKRWGAWSHIFRAFFQDPLWTCEGEKRAMHEGLCSQLYEGTWSPL